MSNPLPSVVIVGRPNVGKSTLFNRLTGTRRSIVTDEPGITRDRIYGTAQWNRRTFEVVDTGGIIPDDKAMIPREIFRQAKVAIESAAYLILVVDSRVGVTPLDAELARLLRRTGKPLAIAVNKVDSPAQAATALAPFYELGTELFPVAAEHGFGVDEMLDAITEEMGEEKEVKEVEEVEEDKEIQVAIIGRPNVGKSTLLNYLVGAERAIVSPEPGTTRDAVDTVVKRNAKAYRFIDTAGIRRKGKTKLVAEKLSVVMARKHLERADVALMVMDASQGVTSNDATIASYAQQSGRSIILVMNKWDLALEAAAKKEREVKKAGEREVRKGPAKTSRFDRHRDRALLKRHPGRDLKHRTAPSRDERFSPEKLLHDYEDIIRRKLKFLDYAPVVFLSAHTGDRAAKLLPLIDQVAEARRRRVGTGEMNKWLAKVDLDRGTMPFGRRMKIYYMTQAGTSPPTFVLFTNQQKPMHFSYERFLENQLRKNFDFTGTPIRFITRVKQR
jgi:GTP-binding protein